MLSLQKVKVYRLILWLHNKCLWGWMCPSAKWLRSASVWAACKSQPLFAKQSFYISHLFTGWLRSRRERERGKVIHIYWRHSGFNCKNPADLIRTLDSRSTSLCWWAWVIWGMQRSESKIQIQPSRASSRALLSPLEDPSVAAARFPCFTSVFYKDRSARSGSEEGSTWAPSVSYVRCGCIKPNPAVWDHTTMHQWACFTVSAYLSEILYFLSICTIYIYYPT